MLTGLRTTVYSVPDLKAAADWYTELLGYGPYFDQPFYVGFNVGGFELGLLPGRADQGRADAAAVVCYWGVADVPTAVARSIALGASLVEDAHDVGGGIILASLLDPFGNPLGLIDNPEFRAALGQPAATPADLSPRSIQRDVQLPASPEQVFSMWTTSAGLARWWVSDARIELSLGGAFTLRFLLDQPPGLQGSEDCRILSWLPNRMLSFSWNAPPHLPTRGQRTLVVLEFLAEKGGTRLVLNHHGWPTSGLADEASGWPKTLAYFEQAWTAVLARLAQVLAEQAS
ncbi:MAG: hypothetical protein GXP62_19065 [Oligoflexia bacterium]|nr:hypothetical protein [Oligoflexia bacterium]